MVVAGAAIIAYTVSRFGWRDVARASLLVGPFGLATVVIALGWHACSAAALRWLLDRRVPWRTLLWVRLAADGYNSLIASVGGEPFRVRQLSRYVPSEQVITAMMRERVIDLASGYLVSSLFILFGLRAYALPAAVRGSVIVYAICVVALSLAGTVAVVTRLPARASIRILRWLGVSTSSPPEALPLSTFARVLLCYAAARFLGLCEIGLLLWALGLGVHPLEIGFIDAMLNAAGTVSFMVPQAMGVFEGTSVFLFETLGHAGAAGIAFALVRRGRMIAISLAGVALHWIGRARPNDTADDAAVRRRETWARWWYTLLGAPRALGRPQVPSRWEQQFAGGFWDKLDSAAQLAHYAVIFGYARHFAGERGRILDVGCGHGTLYGWFRDSPIAAYHGIDISEIAIARAQQRARPTARFEVAGFEQWTTTERFDAVIFNESIYYAKRPLDELRRYAGFVADDGVLIVSMVRSSMTWAIARAMRRQFVTVHATIVQNEDGESWEVRVLRAHTTGDATAARR